MGFKIKEWIFNVAVPIVAALIPSVVKKEKGFQIDSNNVVNIVGSNIGQLNIYISEIKNKNVEERDFINITDVDGIDKTVEVILFFTLKKNGKDYIVYTDYPEKYTDEGDVIIYTSIVNDIGDTVLLEGIETQEEVDEIMQVFADISGESADQIKHLGEYNEKRYKF